MENIITRIARRILKKDPSNGITIKKITKLKGLKLIKWYEVEIEDGTKIRGETVHEVKQKMLDYEKRQDDEIEI